MRLRLITACLAASCVLALPGVASAGVAPPAKVTVRSCHLGEQRKDREATFYARMRAVPGTKQMQMRFTLVDKSGDGRPSVVQVPALQQWRKSRTGVKTFGYAQTVAGLVTGGRYSVRVQFRWLDGRGRTIARTRRTSGECRQQGSLPNLEITRVAARAGETSGTLIYSIEVTNSGRGEARDVIIEPFIDGAAADAQKLDLLEAGETKTLYVTGPTCKRRVRVVVDRAGTVNETNDDDNVQRYDCPLTAE